MALTCPKRACEAQTPWLSLTWLTNAKPAAHRNCRRPDRRRQPAPAGVAPAEPGAAAGDPLAGRDGRPGLAADSDPALARDRRPRAGAAGAHVRSWHVQV